MKTAIVVSLFATLLIGCSAEEGDFDWGPQIQRANEELLNKGNLELAQEIFAPTYVAHVAEGDIEGGPDAIKAFVTSLRTAFPDLEVEVEILATEGDRVVWLRTHRGTHQGEYLGVPASGRLITWREMIVTRYEEGKIAEEWGVSDLAENLHAPQSGTVESGMFQLDYRIEGVGDPAIVIGFPNYYTRLFSQGLRSHLQLVFVDHRGTAPSPGPVPVSEFSLDRISDDIELVRTELGLGKVAIIGHSGHALMALEYAKKYPDSVSHVVMIGIAPDLGDASSAERQRYWDESASAERKAAFERNWRGVSVDEPEEAFPGQNFIQAYVRNGPMAWYDPDFDSSPFWEGVEVNMDMFNLVWGTLLAEIDITQGLDAFERPVFLALGRYDFLVAPPSSWDPVKPHFNDLTVRIFEESGHTPQYEQAALFDSEVLTWMRETGSP